MIHHAILTLAPFVLKLEINGAAVDMPCADTEIDVSYNFTPCSEGDQYVCKALRVSLRRALALHDSPDTISLIFSPGADLLPYLTARQVDWIEENLPVPTI